jgi:serpin B
LSEASKAAANLLNSTDTNLILTTANALWYRKNTAIKPDFLAVNQKYFSSAIQPVDFSNAPAAETEINQWASDQTHGRITAIADGMVAPDTDLILANAIYFKGKWQDPFDKSLTKERPFHPVVGEEKKLPTMHRSDRFQYREGTGYQAVRLPYEGGDLAMYVFLPERGSSPTKLLQILNGNKWRNVTMPGFSEREGLVELPKFKLENTFELVKPLQALGMKSAFTVQADFSGMFTDKHKISKVRQKTIVEVGEEGTEATAVTVVSDAPGDVVMMNPPPRPKPFEMVVDRPFLFTVVDARSEMILFMGVVNDL